MLEVIGTEGEPVFLFSMTHQLFSFPILVQCVNMGVRSIVRHLTYNTQNQDDMYNLKFFFFFFFYCITLRGIDLKKDKQPSALKCVLSPLINILLLSF